ncbi:helix-turn-helix domain-containing protein [Amycolatopsis sp. cmx-4-68]|uniref:helix-turn-helix domain-containing protein n=1 Tax=Amycolatopsis sp. cmx-4-68 TaxID=2790938 RepID=UPI003979B830
MSRQSATPRARALGFGIRRARLARRLGVRELGRLTDLVPQNISSWESGKRVPKLEELATILGALRVEPGKREQLLNLARSAHEASWLGQYTLSGPTQLVTYLEYERAASSVFNWSPGLLPGLLQTPAYMKTIFAATARPKRDVDEHIMVRLARRELLTGRNPLQYQAVLSEAVLRQNMGGPAVMAEQLRHLRSTMRLRNVSVRILPDGIGYHPGQYGPFIVFRYDDSPPVVYLEHYRSSAYLEHDATGYGRAVEILWSLALGEQDSERRIEQVIADLAA